MLHGKNNKFFVLSLKAPQILKLAGLFMLVLIFTCYLEAGNNASAQNNKDDLRNQLNEIQNKIDEYQSNIQETLQQKKSLSREVNLFDQEIKKQTLQI